MSYYGNPFDCVVEQGIYDYDDIEDQILQKNIDDYYLFDECSEQEINDSELQRLKSIINTHIA